MSPTFKLGAFSIDEDRPIKVVVIGAGYSGIVAGIRFRQRIKNLDFAVYESNAGIGGTWYTNRYPGIMCDIPSHAYQPTFENHADWSAFYASGEEIRQNLENVVDKYQLRPHIKLQHRLTGARYVEESGKWHLQFKKSLAVANASSQSSPFQRPNYEDWEDFQDIADILFLGVGSLSRWEWPGIPGLETFSGQVMHSADWIVRQEHLEETLANKKVGVIGVGSSAIQIVSAIQPKVKHLVNYVRGKTWISSTFVRDSLLRLSKDEFAENYQFTEEDKKDFRDPKYYNEFRRGIESDMNVAHCVTLVGNPLATGARVAFKESMLQKLSKRPWIADHLVPEFGVGCRRLTPGPGYLEALCRENVSFVPSQIKCVTPSGIETVDGQFQELDIIVCATGFDISFHYGFNIVGRGGVTLNDHHTPHPRTYLSVAMDGFPNMFQALGPNSGAGAGNLLLIMERQVDYAVAATLKLQRESLKSIEAKVEAVEDFERYIDSYFPTTVFGTKCRSWYKAGKEEGRVVALWPGSPAHAAKALTHPRWEDFNYEFLDGVKNRFYWLGDGNTVADKDTTIDNAWYLRPENIDHPPVLSSE